MTIYSGFSWIFPLKMMIFHSFLYVYQRVSMVFRGFSHVFPHPSAMLAIISCIAASILVTLSGICEWPKGPLKGALTAVATPWNGGETDGKSQGFDGKIWEDTMETYGNRKRYFKKPLYHGTMRRYHGRYYGTLWNHGFFHLFSIFRSRLVWAVNDGAVRPRGAPALPRSSLTSDEPELLASPSASDASYGESPL